MARLKLEAFGKTEALSEHIALEPIEFEEVKLASFEQGYSAGWEDAVAAQNAETTRLRSDLGRNLLQISMSYEEARRHVLEALDPLLRDMVSKVMPRIAKETLPQMVLEQMKPLAATIASTPITIIANPTSLPQIRELLTTQSDMPFHFLEEPSLSEGQVYLRTGKTEQRIDLDGVINAIGGAIASYYRIETTEHENG